MTQTPKPSGVERRKRLLEAYTAASNDPEFMAEQAAVESEFGPSLRDGPAESAGERRRRARR